MKIYARKSLDAKRTAVYIDANRKKPLEHTLIKIGDASTSDDEGIQRFITISEGDFGRDICLTLDEAKGLASILPQVIAHLETHGSLKGLVVKDGA